MPYSMRLRPPGVSEILAQPRSIALTLLALLLVSGAASAAFFGYEDVSTVLSYTAPEVVMHPAGSDSDVRSRAFGANLTSYSSIVKASNAVDTVCNPWFSPDLFLYSPRLGLSLLLCWMQRSGGSGGYQGVVYFDPAVSYDAGTGSAAIYANVSSGVATYNYVYGFVYQPFLYLGEPYGINGSASANITFSFNGTVDYVSGYVEAYIIVVLVNESFNVLGYAAIPVYLAYWGLTFYSLLDGTWHNVTVSYTPSDINVTPGLYYLLIGFLVNVTEQSIGPWTTEGAFQGIVHVDLVHNYLPMNDTLEGFYLTEPVFRVEYNSAVYQQFNLTLDGRGSSGLYGAYGWFMNVTAHPVGANVSIADAGLDIGIVAVYGIAPRGASGWLNASLVYYAPRGVRVEYPLNIAFVDPRRPGGGGIRVQLSCCTTNTSLVLLDATGLDDKSRHAGGLYGFPVPRPPRLEVLEMLLKASVPGAVSFPGEASTGLGRPPRGMAVGLGGMGGAPWFVVRPLDGAGGHTFESRDSG